MGEKKRRAAPKQTNWKDQLEIILMIEAGAMTKVDGGDDLLAIDPSVECLTVGVISQLADNVRDLPDIQRGTVCKKMSFLKLMGRLRITMDDAKRMRMIDVSVPDNFTIPRGQPGFLIPIEVGGGVASFPGQQASTPMPDMDEEHERHWRRLMRSLKAGNAATTD